MSKIIVFSRAAKTPGDSVATGTPRTITGKTRIVQLPAVTGGACF
ncbi:MAG: hypothetical protein ACXVNO_09830 [Bacteroidia bacterium]